MKQTNQTKNLNPHLFSASVVASIINIFPSIEWNAGSAQLFIMHVLAPSFSPAFILLFHTIDIFNIGNNPEN